VILFSPMQKATCVALLILAGIHSAIAVDSSMLHQRRQRAASAFPDGILLLHANSRMDISGDGYRQDPYFYYLTGQENVVGALLAIEGKSGESWLFLPSPPPFSKLGLKAPLVPGPQSAHDTGIDHVVDWTELSSFLAARAGSSPVLYYTRDDLGGFPELPANLLSSQGPEAPAWLQVILQKWPSFTAKDGTDALNKAIAVQDADGIANLRAVGKSTVAAIMAGMRAIRPGVSQRAAESAVESACWAAGDHGSNFWPWVMSGENAVFPRPFASFADYNHLNRTMQAGELVRLDVGCEHQHYQGDLGRTVPVSGHYSDGQRETWNIFIAAYRKAAATFRAGVKIDDVYGAWSKELLSHRAAAKSALAQHAIDSWSKRENVPFWGIHTTNVVAWWPPDPLAAGTVINFEPIASVDGQGFFLEDMYLITKDGAEILTPGVPYTAEEIEAGMR